MGNQTVEDWMDEMWSEMEARDAKQQSEMEALKSKQQEVKL